MDKKGLFVGGNFWDGRATGEKLGNPAADQAQGPFLNPNEQALATPADVVSRVCNGDYGDLFRQVWGKKSCVSANVNMAYDQIALSIAAYEDSPEVNAFTSKWDYSFKGKAKLTNLERRGFALFQGKGQCKLCHVSNGQNAGHDHRLGHSNLQESQLAKVDSDAKEGAGRNDDQGQNALFTDFTFDNLGMPQNPENPAGVASAFVDLGLGSFLKNAGYSEKVYSAEWGKHKVPTLRNVDLRPYPGFVKAYGHNGYFKSLEAIVHFYNTRDVLPRCENINSPQPGVNCWPAPEVPQNVNTAELGNLGLTPEEEAAIVAFLKTLSDGYKP